MNARILGAWAMGVAAGFATATVMLGSGIGCVGKARAADTATAACKPGAEVSHQFSGRAPADLANIGVLVSTGNPNGSYQPASHITVGSDGTVTATCIADGDAIFSVP